MYEVIVTILFEHVLRVLLKRRPITNYTSTYERGGIVFVIFYKQIKLRFYVGIYINLTTTEKKHDDYTRGLILGTIAYILHKREYFNLFHRRI